ncbi:hypothetical protein [Sphingomonas corticis]|jgi:hypothetical protein|uniref:Uncharacterized protein n=1 Tax=Sphingomonas corticis TaxID=2722791 RepID=A0ABX1CKQ2_9SPHN|nr:hypothetical protein [Sphingomonas corticis]NJR78544.1 hypothetical protein [Sphingomonas corticis]
MRNRQVRLIAAVAPVALLTAAARDAETRTVGAWAVTTSADGDGCFLSRDYDRPGATTLLLGLDRAGRNHVSVLNRNWSIKPKDRLALTFRLSRGGYVDQASVGMASDGKRGFVTAFETRFPRYFAASTALAIFRGTVPVERLPLDGSGAAVAALRQCVAALGDAPARPKEHGARIPKDPFAKNADRESRD